MLARLSMTRIGCISLISSRRSSQERRSRSYLSSLRCSRIKLCCILNPQSYRSTISIDKEVKIWRKRIKFCCNMLKYLLHINRMQLLWRKHFPSSNTDYSWLHLSMELLVTVCPVSKVNSPLHHFLNCVWSFKQFQTLLVMKDIGSY